MARGDDNIGYYLAGYLSQPAAATEAVGAVAYLVGKIDAASGANARTKGQLTAALDLIFTPTGAHPFLAYWANYLSSRYAATVGSAPKITTASSGGGLRLEAGFATPAIAEYATALGKRDAQGADPTSLELFSSHAVIAAGGPLNVLAGWARAPLPGVARILPAADGPVTYTITGIRPNGAVESEQIKTLVGNVAVAGKFEFTEIVSLASNVATIGDTTVSQIMPVRAAAALVLALQAVFG